MYVRMTIIRRVPAPSGGAAPFSIQVEACRPIGRLQLGHVMPLRKGTQGATCIRQEKSRSGELAEDAPSFQTAGRST